MNPANLPFDSEAMLQGLRSWVECESPTWDASAVERMLDLAAREMAIMGATIERIAGRQGFAGCVRARFPHPKQGEPGILIAGHLDTVGTYIGLSVFVVTVTKLDNNYHYAARTNDSGYYTVGQLLEGEYDLSAEAQGFKKFVEKGLRLSNQELRRIDIRMQTGALETTIEVTGTTGLIETDAALDRAVVDPQRSLLHRQPGQLAGGTISGTPTTLGLFTGVARATNVGFTDQAFSITVTCPRYRRPPVPPEAR